MITAVDSSVLLDVFLADPTHGVTSAELLRRCLVEGRIVACEVVWAEVISAFPDDEAGRRVLDRLDIDFDALGLEAAETAGRLWRQYRARGGRRTRVVADFLIGAHALVQAERLLTRDRGFYRAYFDELVVIRPS